MWYTSISYLSISLKKKIGLNSQVTPYSLKKKHSFKLHTSFKFNVWNYILWKTYFSVLNFPHFATNQLNFAKVFGTQLTQGIWL